MVETQSNFELNKYNERKNTSILHGQEKRSVQRENYRNIQCEEEGEKSEVLNTQKMTFKINMKYLGNVRGKGEKVCDFSFRKFSYFTRKAP